MKSLTKKLFIATALVLGAASGAQAQSCGSGGGATVCLTATPTASGIQLNWTVTGNAQSFQVYRDTDSNPTGRSRLALLKNSVTSYADNAAVAGTHYWYWIKFNATGNSYDTTAATAERVGVIRDLTSIQLSREMSPGINLGNTMEAIPSETSWGNPPTTQVVMNAYKAAGFKSVRIPLSWSQYADANYNISPTWMARVQQVVNYARAAGLYTVINIHWDGGWMNNCTYADQAGVNAKLAAFWTQIATTFKDYDDYLLFAGSNEVGQHDTWGAPTAEYAAVQNSYNQTFVNTVRATGGNNAARHLVVQGYFTNIDDTVATNTVPVDSAANRLFMEVHYYDPYDFTLNGSSTIWQWGMNATDPSAVETWANEPWVDAEFQKMKTRFLDQGVAVLVGEYAAGMKSNYPGMNSYRLYWDQYITHSAFQHGLVPMYWDTGSVINRSTGVQTDPITISTIVNAAK